MPPPIARNPLAQAIASPPKTIQEIDDLIFALYPGGGNGRGRLNSKGNSSGLIQNTFRKNPFNKNNFESVDTSINDNDCLIHAFLIDVSPNFRRLTNDERDDFADQFRRRIMIEYYDAPYRPQVIRYLNSTGFLSFDFLLMLRGIFHVNVVMLDNDGIHTFHGKTKEDQRNTFSRYIEAGQPIVFVYNPDNAHFRAVRQKDPVQYLFSHDVGKAHIATMMKNSHLPEKPVAVAPALVALASQGSAGAGAAAVSNENFLKRKGLSNNNLARLKSFGANLGSLRLGANTYKLTRQQILNQILPSSKGSPGAGNGSSAEAAPVPEAKKTVSANNYLKGWGVTNSQIAQMKATNVPSLKEIIQFIKEAIAETGSKKRSVRQEAVKQTLERFGYKLNGGGNRTRRHRR